MNSLKIKIGKRGLSNLIIHQFKENSTIPGGGGKQKRLIQKDFKKKFCEGLLDETVEQNSFPREIELVIKENGVISELIGLNQKSLEDSQEYLNLNYLKDPNKKLAFAKELYELLEPLRVSDDFKFEILDKELWDYLSTKTFRNFIVARWKTDSYNSFMPRLLLKYIEEGGEVSSQITMTSRAKHALYRLYRAYEIVQDWPKKLQQLLFSREQHLQDFLQRSFFAKSPKLIIGTLLFMLEKKLGDSDEHLKKLSVYQNAISSRYFQEHFDAKDYSKFLNRQLGSIQFASSRNEENAS